MFLTVTDREIKGMMVFSEWPPTKGTVTSFGSAPVNWAINVAARTESNVETPITLPGQNFPECFNTSHTNGTNEFTGFVMSNKMASGEYCAIAYKEKSRDLSKLS